MNTEVDVMARLLDDAYLKPWEGAIRARAARADALAERLAGTGRSLADWASAHEYYGLHFDSLRARWVFREWAPNATSIWLVGDFSAWKVEDRFRLHRAGPSGAWEVECAEGEIREGDNYRLEMEWDGGRGERLPAYARYVVQDAKTGIFAARVHLSRYQWKHPSPPRPLRPLIYEAHVGMSGEGRCVHGYSYFRDSMLPRILKAGYNTVQLMAVMEHPYYGSFGYHVSSFFAASSRFGTPDELKSLVDTAHSMGLGVIMDLVHSHAVKNEREGLSRFDGTEYQYFHAGARGQHSAWDSRCFDYGKTEVLHFLLSNCRFWLDEYRFDGFRFDGVTSMLFRDHGLGTAFTGYPMYFGANVDEDALAYLSLANRVIHEVSPSAVTIAEDVSGMPGVAASRGDCGIGFDYRMAMGEPDWWFKVAETRRDDDWSMGEMMRELTMKRPEEKVVSYVESHDQALVGGKTFFFQLADASVYSGMRNEEHPEAVDRAVALHKMARLATFALNGGAYLNFMGNEFGHPEWIDFPREGNGWSYEHARRLWSLRDDPFLKFRALADFDEAFLALDTSGDDAMTPLVQDDDAKVLAFIRWQKLFVFNFHPVRSHEGYQVIIPPATRWRHVLDSDEGRFGGFGRIAKGMEYSPVAERRGSEIVQVAKLYLPARTAAVFSLAF